MASGRRIAASALLLLLARPSLGRTPPPPLRPASSCAPLGLADRTKSLETRAAAWMGVSVAAGSQALLVFAALPRALPAPARRTVAAVLTLLVLVVFDALLGVLGGQAAVQTALSGAAQSLAIAAAGWSGQSVASIAYPDASTSFLERVAVGGAALCAAVLRSVGSTPLTSHLLLPFVALLAHGYAHILRHFESWSYESSVSYASVCTFVSGIASALLLAALYAQRRAASATPGRARACAQPAHVVGLEPTALLAVVAQLVWTALSLGTWALAPAPAFGFALVAIAMSATELGVYALSTAGAPPAYTELWWQGMEELLLAFNCGLHVIALWRALWLPEARVGGEPPSPVERRFFGGIELTQPEAFAAPAEAGAGGRQRSRLERHFLSLVLTFIATAGTAALRGESGRAIGSTCAVLLVIGRTLVESIWYDNPLVLAGAAGLLLGGALISAIIVYGK